MIRKAFAASVAFLARPVSHRIALSVIPRRRIWLPNDSCVKERHFVLVVPPMLICVGITWMAYKKRNQFNED